MKIFWIMVLAKVSNYIYNIWDRELWIMHLEYPILFFFIMADQEFNKITIIGCKHWSFKPHWPHVNNKLTRNFQSQKRTSRNTFNPLFLNSSWVWVHISQKQFNTNLSVASSFHCKKEQTFCITVLMIMCKVVLGTWKRKIRSIFTKTTNLKY